MSGDRNERRGGTWDVPTDDQSDAEPEMTGEFTIDYTPPAWYTQGSAPAAPVSVPGLPEGSGFEPHRPSDAAEPPTMRAAPPSPGRLRTARACRRCPRRRERRRPCRPRPRPTPPIPRRTRARPRTRARTRAPLLRPARTPAPPRTRSGRRSRTGRPPRPPSPTRHPLRRRRPRTRGRRPGPPERRRRTRERSRTARRHRPRRRLLPSLPFLPPNRRHRSRPRRRARSRPARPARRP